MLVQTEEQFVAMRDLLAEAERVTVDTETTGLSPHTGDRLCGVATRCMMPGTPYIIEAYFPFRHKPGDTLFTISENLPMEWLPVLLAALNKPDGTLRFHHAKFDLLMMAYEGEYFDFHRNPFECTQIMSWYNCEWESHRLKDLHDKYIKGSDSKSRESTIKEWVKHEGSYANVPPFAMEPYACGDVRDTDDVYAFLHNNLIAQFGTKEMETQLEREYEFTRVLFEMELNGIGIDLSLCETLSAQAAGRRQSLLLDLGFDPMKSSELARRLFATPPEGLGLRAPDALTRTTSQHFPKGIPELRKDWLSQYSRLPVVSSVLEYKALVKADSTWYRGFQEHARATKDGRIHTTYNGTGRGKSKLGLEGKTGTVTGRLNSSNPNVHQIPRQDEEVEAELQRKVKEVFIPGRAGYSLWELDYDQIEVRIAAGYGNAVPMLDAIRSGVDPHRVTAQGIGCGRQTAKHATYTTLYGGGANTLARTIERLEFFTTGKVITYSDEQAQQILDAYFRLYPGYKVVQAQCAQLMKTRGYVSMWDGRRRHYERWFDAGRKRWVDNTHKAFNSVIQGGAASIIKRTMLSLPSSTPKYKLVNQVHDSLWFEVQDSCEKEALEEIKWLMEWPSREVRFKCPFTVSTKLLRRQP